MSEQMEPAQLQALLNDVFSRLTHIIRGYRGTIDKYMGDCVMAFWGAPMATPDHASLAVHAALDMTRAVEQINETHRQRGLPLIGIGIGLNTGTVCVGDMGSDIRRSYTVIGDAVNLGSRLEGLSKYYGAAIVVGETTRDLAPEFAWQQLDLVRVKGKAQTVAIFLPLSELNALSQAQSTELEEWRQFLIAYRAQEWAQCDGRIRSLMSNCPDSALFRLYAARITDLRQKPRMVDWDGATNFDSK